MTISIWLQLILIVSSTGFSKSVEDSLAKSHIFENQNIFENFNFKVENLNINENLMKKNTDDFRDIDHSTRNILNVKNSTFEQCSSMGYPPPTPFSHVPSNCAEALRLSGLTKGVHKIRVPGSHLKPFYVYCLADPREDGGAWTVVQRRIDGSIDFQKPWRDYVRGFGNLEGEFFIGLEKLHELTQSSIHELWIHMEDFENGTRWAKYSSFAIGDASASYALNVLGSYTGDAGDSLTVPHAGQKFSTKDVDNDSYEGNCAAVYTGAWWYNKCHESNLNGQYLRGAYSKDLYGQGIVWYKWKDYYYSLKRVHMAIRA